MATKPVLAVDNQTEPPSLESVSPRYLRVVTKQRELHARREEIEAELKPIVDELTRSRPLRLTTVRGDMGDTTRVEGGGGPAEPPSSFQSPPMQPRIIEPSPAAKKLLGDLAPAARVEIFNAGGPLRRRGAELSAELEAVVEAQAALDPEFRRARYEASAILCDLMRLAYKRVSQRVISAMTELLDARSEHSQFLQNIERRGAIISPLRPIDAFPLAGDGKDAGSPIRISLALAIQQGWADPAIAARWKK